MKTRGIQVSALSMKEADQWDCYIEAQPGAKLYHGTDWIGMISKLFRHETLMLCARDRDGGDIVGVLPLVRLRSILFGDYMVSVPYVNYGGVIADTGEVASALMNKASEIGFEKGISHIEFRDTVHRGNEWQVRTDKVCMVLELPDDPDILWKSIGSKLRAQVKRPQKEGAEAQQGGQELLDGFYRVFSENMRDLGTPVYPKRFFSAIVDNFPDNVRFVVVQLNKVPVAAALLIGHRGTLEIPWASSLRRYNRFGVNMLLYWKVLEYGISAGYRYFDFGRSSRDSGTYRFKRQWGAEERQLYWHYWLREGGEVPIMNPDNPKYRIAISAWKKMPLSVANFIGPFLVKNLP